MHLRTATASSGFAVPLTSEGMIAMEGSAASASATFWSSSLTRLRTGHRHWQPRVSPTDGARPWPATDGDSQCDLPELVAGLTQSPLTAVDG